MITPLTTQLLRRVANQSLPTISEKTDVRKREYMLFLDTTLNIFTALSQHACGTRPSRVVADLLTRKKEISIITLKQTTIPIIRTPRFLRITRVLEGAQHLWQSILRQGKQQCLQRTSYQDAPLMGKRCGQQEWLVNSLLHGKAQRRHHALW